MDSRTFYGRNIQEAESFEDEFLVDSSEDEFIPEELVEDEDAAQPTVQNTQPAEQRDWTAVSTSDRSFPFTGL